MGKKRKLYLILACLVSSFQNLHERALKKKPIPFPSAYTGTKYLVANRWSTGRLGCERFSISTLSLCGPKSGIKCCLFLFAFLPLSLSVTFLVRWLEVTARKQRWEGLHLNHQFGVLPLVQLHRPTRGWSLGLKREALRASPSLCLQAATIFPSSSYFLKRWSFSTLCCLCSFTYDWK